jgi:hypothetical protein
MNHMKTITQLKILHIASETFGKITHFLPIPWHHPCLLLSQGLSKMVKVAANEEGIPLVMIENERKSE